MAKGDTPTGIPDQSKYPAPTAPPGGWNWEGTPVGQKPQQNQYLTGDPNTKDNANTSWMSPSNPSQTTGINGGGGMQQAQNQPIQNGTMLGQITAGNVGQYMPGGYDQGKFGDPNKHDPKYDIGRILSKYPPGPDGLQAARNELQAAGYQVVGRDKIQGPAGIIDVGQSFSDPNAKHSWQWNPEMDAMNGGQQGSMLGSQQGLNQNDFLNQMFQQLMARRNVLGNQTMNPQGGALNIPGTGGWNGGYAPPTGGVSGYANQGPQTPSMFGNQPQGVSYLGGVQQPSMNPIDVLNQMWAGTFQPYRGPQ